MRSRESGGSDAEEGENWRGAVNIGSCIQWRAESGRQRVGPKKWLLTQQSAEGSG